MVAAHLTYLAIAYTSFLVQYTSPNNIFPYPPNPTPGAHPILLIYIPSPPRAARTESKTHRHTASVALERRDQRIASPHPDAGPTPSHPRTLARSMRAPTVCPPTAWSTKKNARNLRVQRASPSAAYDQSISSRQAAKHTFTPSRAPTSHLPGPAPSLSHP